MMSQARKRDRELRVASPLLKYRYFSLRGSVPYFCLVLGLLVAVGGWFWWFWPFIVAERFLLKVGYLT